jgi:UDP-glucose 4-epimerase
MAILVTGGAGYIGSHLVLQLLESGREAIVMDDLSNSKEEALRRIESLAGQRVPFYRVRLANRRGVEKIFAVRRIEAVVHLAGFKSVGESVRIPLEYYSNNVYGTLVLCEAMRKFGVKKMVFSSSATVYGLPEACPVKETFPLSATNPYGRTKLMIEQILRDLHASDPEWSIALLRYFNPAGAHKSGRIGEDPRGAPSNLLPFISQVAVGRRPELTIFGNDYPTPDGTGVRDYLHVEDLAAGHLRALEKVGASRGVEAYNLGTGNGFSVLEMVRAFERVSGRRIPCRFAARRPGDVAVCYADASKARRELGWEARRGIEEMCEDAWRWQVGNPNGYAKTRGGGRRLGNTF